MKTQPPLCAFQRTAICICALLPPALLAAGGARAQTATSFHFIGNTASTANENKLRPTEIAGTVAVANWNNDRGTLNSGSISPVTDSSGAASSTTFSFTAYDTQSNGLDSDPNFTMQAAGQPGPNYQLMNGYVESGPAPDASPAAVLTVGGVSYSTYDLYVYMYNGVADTSADPNAYTGAYTFTPTGAGGSGITIDATRLSTFTGAFVDATSGAAGNYIVFHNLSAGGFTLTAQGLPNASQSFIPINGIQIVAAAPEPSAWAGMILGAGALGLLAIRRRKCEAR